MTTGLQKRLEQLKIEKGRGAKKLSGNQFADFCGIKQRTMAGYLCGKSEPTYQNLLMIAKACNVSVGWLAAGEGEKEPGKNNEVVATIAPGTKEARNKIKIQGERATNKFINLRLITEWMDEYYAEDEAQTIFLLDDMRKMFPSFAKFMEKKRPGRNNLHRPVALDERRETG